MDQGYGSGWHLESKTFKTQPNQAQLLKFSPGIRGMMCFCNSTWKGNWLWPIYLHYKHHLLGGWPVFLTTKKCCITETNKENWHLTIVRKLLFVRIVLLSSDLHPRKRRVHFFRRKCDLRSVHPSCTCLVLSSAILCHIPESRWILLHQHHPRTKAGRLLGNEIKLRCMPRKWLLTP